MPRLNGRDELRRRIIWQTPFPHMRRLLTSVDPGISSIPMSSSIQVCILSGSFLGRDQLQ